MRASRSLGGLLAGSFLVACAGAQVHDASAHPHWAYTGEDGPSAWGGLSPEFAACSTGTTQSPINLTGAIAADLPMLGIVMNPMPLALENNGHTVQQSAPPGSVLEISGKRYELVQFHVHHPSEHTVNGQAFSLEIHFVHKSDHGELAVLGVLVQEGAENSALAPFFEHLPAHAGERFQGPATLDPAAMLPTDHAYFDYPGSFTTPPCSEGVAWYVMKAPISASTTQIASFSALFPLNARPVQPLGTRKLEMGGGAAH